MDFVAIDEPAPGPKWRRRFAKLWHRYRAWYVGEGLEARPAFDACVEALRAHMPELLPTYDRLCALVGDDDVARRFLSCYRPPPVIIGCSVLVAPGDEPVLIRNYDFSPDFFEGTVLRSRWGDRRVIAMSEAFWGALDGMNEAGLTVALTFGGRPARGDGFGIPILLRYVLERCDTAAEAVAVLKRVPVDAVQNVMVLDRSGTHAVVYLSPDREAVSRTVPITTNHQIAVDWPEAARFNETVERANRLHALRAGTGMTLDALADAFHRPPLYRTDYDRWLGTLYTAMYRPARGLVDYRWPGEPAWAQSFAAFTEGVRRPRIGTLRNRAPAMTG